MTTADVPGLDAYLQQLDDDHQHDEADPDHATVNGVVLREQTAGALGLTDRIDPYDGLRVVHYGGQSIATHPPDCGCRCCSPVVDAPAHVRQLVDQMRAVSAR